MSSLSVYVDGFNLYHGLKDQFGRRMLWLDLVALSNRLRPRSSLFQVRYFTAPVLDDPPAASRQGRYQHALLAHNPGLVDIVQGRYQKKLMSCRTCGAWWTHLTAGVRSLSALMINAESDWSRAASETRDVAMFTSVSFSS